MSDLRRHAVPDDVETDGWALRVTGAVERPLVLGPGELASLPVEPFTEDFACVEGWAAAGLSWRGVRVGTLLDRANPTPDAEFGLVRAMDGEYACSFPVDRLADSVLALELDGEAVPVEHGGPARLVPTGGDADCWESVKWVSEVELTASRPTGADTAKRMALSRLD